MKKEEASTKEHKLRVRKRVKGEKPDFRRHESWRYKRVKESWRRSRGIDSKMRKGVKGWPKSVKVGYRGPRGARGLHPSGFEEVLVYNVDEVDRVDPETQAIRIGRTVGGRKRVEISARARERKVYILNPKEEEERVEEIEEVEAEETQGERKG